MTQISASAMQMVLNVGYFVMGRTLIHYVKTNYGERELFVLLVVMHMIVNTVY